MSKKAKLGKPSGAKLKGLPLPRVGSQVPRSRKAKLGKPSGAKLKGLTPFEMAASYHGQSHADFVGN